MNFLRLSLLGSATGHLLASIYPTNELFPGDANKFQRRILIGGIAASSIATLVQITKSARLDAVNIVISALFGFGCTT